MNHIHELRQSRGGKLSGMTMAQIVQQVAERILQAQQAQTHKPIMVLNIFIYIKQHEKE